MINKQDLDKAVEIAGGRDKFVQLVAKQLFDITSSGTIPQDYLGRDLVEAVVQKTADMLIATSRTRK